MRLISLWFGLAAPVSRRAYAASGFGLMALKYAVEAAAIRQLDRPLALAARRT